MLTPIGLLRESFAAFIKRSDTCKVCIALWAEQRGPSVTDACQLVVLEDAHALWLEVLAAVAATREELRGALAKEKREERSHLDILDQEKIFKNKLPPVWFAAGSSDEERWRQLLHLHEDGVDTLVVVDDNNVHVPRHFLEVDPAESGVQFILFSNTTRPVLTGGFAPQVRAYRRQRRAAEDEIGQFLPRIYLAGMLEGVVVLLVTESHRLENAVLGLNDKGVVAARRNVAWVVDALRARHPHLFH